MKHYLDLATEFSPLASRWLPVLLVLLASCDPSVVQQNACVTDTDCGVGLFCIDARCADPSASSHFCNSDADCPGQVCSPVGLCVDGSSEQDCTITSECPESQYCNMAMTRPLCVDLQPGACRLGSQCPGRRCSAPMGGVGRCVDCLANEDCPSGRCWPDGTCEATCTPACDTARGEACVDGACLQDPDWVPPVTCQEHATADALGVCNCDPGYTLVDATGRCEEDDPLPDPCEGETYYGRCDGNTLIYCDEEEVIVRNCSEDGRLCELLEDGYYCEDPTEACDGETATGRCSGNTRVWCEDDTVQREECGALSCQWTSNGYRCLPLTDPCRGETEPGRCDGDTVVYCVDDTVYRLDCSDQDKVCLESYQGATCEDDAGGCGDETFWGRCDGNTVVYCSGDVVRRIDCTELGRQCLEGDYGYACRDAVADPCQGETADGRCDGDVLFYCANEHVVVRDCSDSDRTCGISSGNFHTCVEVEDSCQGESFDGRCDDNTLIWCSTSTHQVYRQDCDEFGENYICGPDPETAELFCVDRCQGETFTGRCQNNILYYCDVNGYGAYDCDEVDGVCGWSRSSGGFVCLI